MKLFESKVRHDKNPSKHNDNTFDYVDRSADRRFMKIRGILNKWFKNYPDEQKNELKIKFKENFDPAFYELFIHELFLKQGYKIKIHPNVPKTDKKPDFLISKGDKEFYVEAKITKDKSQREMANENRINSFYDTLNKLNSPNFFIMIEELNFKTQKQPNVKNAIKYFESELQKLDANSYENIMKVSGFENLPHFKFENEDFSISIIALPKSKKGRGKKDIRPIGVYPFESIIGSSDKNIKATLMDKATKYGDLGEPYIICLNSFSDRGSSQYDVFNALFGSLQFVSYINKNNPKDRIDRNERATDGFFLSERGPQFTRVSAILITKIHIGNINNSQHWFVKHPFARKEIDLAMFDLTYFEVIGNKIQLFSKKDIGQLLSQKP